ncbi:MAG: phosphoglycerate dehydrogenase [Candidatus Dormibacteria bacterium]
MGGRPRILVADPLAEDGLERLRAFGEVEVRLKLSEEELAAAVDGFEALVVRSESRVTEKVLRAGTGLKVVARAGVGVDNIDVRAATICGVVVVNAPTGNTVAAAEHTIAMMLAAARMIPQADQSVREGRWERARFMGTELRHKTLGLCGLGNIGAEVAKRAQGLEMQVIAFDPVVSQERAESLSVELVTFEELLLRADVVSLHVPLVDSTRGLFGDDAFAKVREGMILVNCARGGIVDEAALVRALDAGRVRAAAFDVFEHEPPDASGSLVQHPAVITTPHIAGSTRESQTNVAFDIVDQVEAVLSGAPARYAVNAPKIAPEELALLSPYLELAEKLGLLAAQMGVTRVSQLEVAYHGEIATYETSFLTAEVIRGLMSVFSEARVNPVNARSVAASHGIKVLELRDTTSGVYANLLSVTVTGQSQQALVSGTLALNVPRVVRIDEHSVDLVPRGQFILTHHRDQPGLVGRVGTLLGEANVNIAGLQLGRDAPRGLALMVLQVDDPVSAPVLDRLRELPGMEELRHVSL